MAEGVFAHKVQEAGFADEIEVDSAGTGHWHTGEPPHAGTRRLLAAHHIPYHNRARQIRPEDLQQFDYILTMDEENYRDVLALPQGKAQVIRFLDFAPETGRREVPDPYYTGVFQEVYELCERAADGLLQHLGTVHSL